MTRIEKDIHRALEAEATTLDQLAVLYAKGSRANFNVYRRIDWKAVETAIELKRGKAGLVYVMLESRRHE